MFAEHPRTKCELYSMVLGFYSVVVTNSEELYRFKNGSLWCFLKASFKNKRWTVSNNLLHGFMEMIHSELQKLEIGTLWKIRKHLTNYNMHSKELLIREWGVMKFLHRDFRS
jgi:hypothetical protein